MTNPKGHDIYYTQIKTKYLKGLVASTGSLADASGTTLNTDAYIEIEDSDGTTYYLPLYDSTV